MHLFLAFLTLWTLSLASSGDIPEYSKQCPPITSLSKYDQNTFVGFWYEVVASTNVPFDCAIFNTSEPSDEMFHSPGKVRFIETQQPYLLDIHWQTGKPPNANVEVMDIFDGYLYHIVLYPLDYTPELLVTYACTLRGNTTEENIHVFSKRLPYNQTKVQLVLESHDLLRIPTREQFANCSQEYYHL